MDNYRWLVTDQEANFTKKKFKGKLAGKAYSYCNHIDGIVRTRMIIFIMSILVFYPIISNYIFHDFFDSGLLIERSIYSCVLIIAGMCFNKLRILSILTAAIPIGLIVVSYLIIPENFTLKPLAFSLAILILILMGIYHHIMSKKLKKSLEHSLIENNLIDF